MEVSMKKRSNLLFAAAFTGSILLCSLILVLIFSLSKAENEGKVKKVSVEASQDMVELSYQDVNGNIESGNTSDEMDKQDVIHTQQTQEKTDLQSKENDHGLISGVEDKSLAVNKEIVKITINASVDEVTVYQGDGEALELTQNYKNIDKDDLLSVTKLSNELLISTKYTDPGFRLPGIINSNRSSSLKIKLPKDFQGKLEVTSDVGNVYIENELKLEELVISSNVGDIIVRSTQNLRKAKLSTEVGNVEIKKEWNVEISSLATAVGNVTIHNGVKAEKLFIDVDMGNVSVPTKVKENPNYSISTELGEIITDGKNGTEIDSLLMHLFNQS